MISRHLVLSLVAAATISACSQPSTTPPATKASTDPSAGTSDSTTAAPATDPLNAMSTTGDNPSDIRDRQVSQLKNQLAQDESQLETAQGLKVQLQGVQQQALATGAGKIAATDTVSGLTGGALGLGVSGLFGAFTGDYSGLASAAGAAGSAVANGIGGSAQTSQALAGSKQIANNVAAQIAQVDAQIKALDEQIAAINAQIDQLVSQKL